MDKNLDPQQIVMSRGMFDRLLRKANCSPKELQVELRSIRKLNPEYGKEHRDGIKRRQAEYSGKKKSVRRWLGKNSGKWFYPEDVNTWAMTGRYRVKGYSMCGDPDFVCCVAERLIHKPIDILVSTLKTTPPELGPPEINVKTREAIWTFQLPPGWPQ